MSSVVDSTAAASPGLRRSPGRPGRRRAAFWAGGLFVAVWCAGCGGPERVGTPEAEAPPLRFAPEVDAVLQKRLRAVEQLAADPEVRKAAAAANAARRELDQGEIERLDARWRHASLDDPLVSAAVRSPTADRLRRFQQDHDGFVEIFVTDAKGLVAAATNQTTDFWQADEPWWRAAYAEGEGRSFYGAPEYDLSARAEAISFYAPVRDAAGRIAGVVKAVCDLAAIKREL